MKEKMFKIYEEHADGAHLVVSPDQDGNKDYLVISTGGCEESRHYFGNVAINITKIMARELGEALIEIAGENSEK